MLRNTATSLVTAVASPLAARTLAPAIATAASRTYATKKVSLRMDCVGKLMDPYVRPDRFPLPFSAEGRKECKDYLMNLAQSTFDVSRLKSDLDGFKANKFGLEAEQIYVKMNTMFADGKPDHMAPYVTSQMLSTLKNQMKNRPGTFKWEYLGAVERPKIVNLRYSKSPEDQIGVAQITVKIKSKQRLAVLDAKGKAITSQELEPVEYVVYERFIPDGKAWRIAGKIEQPAK
ncbi:39S ribosomal protein L45, mitochondrial [Allomyces javanicus]|nr:39S ribosomal protein L45, mitochondrial [Allomyces javanicus]